MESVGPHGQNAHFQVQKSPRTVHGFFGDLEFRPHFCQNLTWTSLKTLPKEPVGPHGQNDLFSRSNDPWNLTYGVSWPSRPKRPIFKVKQSMDFAKILPGRPLRPYLWSQLVLTAKKAHFQGETIPRADITYGASWPTRPTRLIFKLKQYPEQTLTMELVGPHIQHDQFSWSIVLQSSTPSLSLLALTANTTYFHGKKIPGADLTYGASWPCKPKRPIFKVKRSPEQNFDLIFAKILPECPLRPQIWSLLDFTAKTAHFRVKQTLEQTLPMDSVGPHGQNGPFSRSNKPQSCQLALMAKMAHIQDQMIPGVDLTYGASCPSWLKWPIFKVKQAQSRKTPSFTEPHLWSQLAITAKMDNFQGQTIPGNHNYGASWPSRPKRTIFKNFDIIFAKILLGHSLRPYLWSQLALTDKTAHFQGQTIPRAVLPGRPLRPYLWSLLALTAKTTHFQGETRPKANVPEDFTYRASWPSRPTWPIFKTSAKTLPMELVGPHGQNGPFSRSNDPRSRIRPRFCQNFTWTSIKNLPVGHHGQNDPFSRLNKPKSNWPSLHKRPIFKVKRSPEHVNPPFCQFSSPSHPKRPIGKVKRAPEQLALTAKMTNFHGQTIPRAVKTLHMEPLALTAKMTYFQGQTIPGTGKPPILPIFVCYSPLIFGDSEFRPHFSQTFTWTSVKTLPMELVGPHGQNGPFSRSNNPRICGFFGDTKFRPYFCQNVTWMYVKTLTIELVGPHGQNGPFSRILTSFLPKFYLDIHKTVPMEPVDPHKQNNPFSRSNDTRSRPYLWSQLALTSEMAHFHGQTIPRNSNLNFAKNLPGYPLRPYLWSQLTITNKTTDFYGQTIPGADLTYVANWPSRPKQYIFKNSDLNFAKILPGYPLKPYLWSQFTIIAKTAHFQCQTIPRADLTYGTSWPSLPKWLIFKAKRSPNPLRPYLWTMLALTAKTTHFQGKTKSQTNWPSRPKWHIFKVKGVPEQTFVKTLPMETVGPHSQNGPFSRSIDPQRKPYLWNQLSLTAKTAHFQSQTIAGADLTYEASWTSRPKWPIFKVKRSLEQFTIFFGDPEFRPYFCKILHVCPLRPYLWNQLAFTAKMAHFKSQTILGTSFKTLPMEPVGPHGQKGPFSRKNKIPEQTSVKTLPMEPIGPHAQNGTFSRLKTTVKTLPIEPVGPHDQNDPFPMSNVLQSSPLAPTAKTAHFQVKQSPEQTSVKTLPMEPITLTAKTSHFQDLTYGARWPSQPKRPIIKNFDHILAKLFPGHPLRPYYGSSWPSRPKWPIFKTIFKVKRSPEQTLPMEPFGPHIQNGPLSRSNNPQSRKTPSFIDLHNSDHIFAKILPGHLLRPYLWSQLALTAKTAHFQGQTCSRVGDPKFRPHFCQNFAWTSVKTLTMELIGPHGQNGPFSTSNDPRSRFFGDAEFRPHFCLNLTCMSVKTLPIERIDPHSQNGPFSRSNDPQSRPYLWIQLAITPKMAYFQGQTIPRVDLTYGTSWPSHLKRQIFKTLPMEPVDPHGQNGPLSRSKNPQSSSSYFLVIRHEDLIFAKILHGGPLKPYLLSQLVLTAETSNFQVLTNPRADLTYGSIWYSRPKRSIFRVKRAPELTLTMELIDPHGQNGLFSTLNDPRSNKLTLTAETAHFQDQMIPRSDLTYGASWPPLPKRPIFKVKQSPEQNFDIIFAKILPGRPLRTYLWSQLALTFEMTHFQGQTIPRVVLPGRPLRPYLWSQLALTAKTASYQGQTTSGQDLIFAKIIRGRPLRPYLWSQLALTAKTAHFQNFDHIFAKILPRCLLRHYLLSQLAFRAKTAHFQCQTCSKFTWMSVKTLTMELIGPHGQNGPFLTSNDPQSRPCLWSELTLTAKTAHFHLTYGASWPSWPKQPIFKVKRPPEQAVSLRGQNVPLSRSNKPQSRFSCAIVHGFYSDLKFRPQFCKNFTWTSVKTLSMEPFTIFLGDSKFRTHLSQNFTWTSVMTLPMEPDGYHSQNGPLPMSNKSQSSSPSFLVIQNYDIIIAKILPGRPLRPFLWNHLSLMSKTAHFQVQKPQELTLHMEPVGPHSQNGPFSSSNKPKSCRCSQPKRPTFKVKRSSEQTLPMEPVGPHDQNDLFSRSNDPRRNWPSRPKRPIYKVKRSTEQSQLALTANTAHFRGETIPRTDVREDLTYGGSWPSRPTMPIFKVNRAPNQPKWHIFKAKRSPEQPRRPIFMVKQYPEQTLAMELVSPHAQHGQFSRSIILQRRPYLWGQLALTAKTAHFQGQTSPEQTIPMEPVDPHIQKGPFSRISTLLLPKFYMDVRYELTYRAIWPSRPIFKVKRALEQTLPMEPVGSHCQNGPFSRKTDPRSSLLDFTVKTTHFHGQTSPRADLTYGASWPSCPKRPIFKVKQAKEQLAFTAKMAHIKDQTIPGVDLPMGPVGQNGPFARSNKPIAGKPPLLPISCAIVHHHFWLSGISTLFFPNIYLDVHKDLTYRASCPLHPIHHIFKVKRAPEQTITMKPVGPHGQCGNFQGQTIARAGRPLRPYLCSQLALSNKMAHFQNETFSGVDLTYGASSPSQLKRPIFKVKQAPDQTSPMEPVGPHRQNGPFSRSNDPRNLTYGASWPSRPKRPINKVKQSPKQQKIYLDVRVDLTYGANCPSHPKQPIFKVIRKSDLIFAKILPGRPLRPYLWSKFALTAKIPHFQGQTIPGECKPTLLPIFICYSSPSFLVIQNSDLIFAKIIPGRPLKPYLWNQLARTAKMAHFKGQTIPGNYDLIFANILPGCPLRPCQWSELTLTAKTAHFHLTYGASWPSWPKLPFPRSNVLPSKETPSFTDFHTLPMEPVGPHGQNGPFSRSNKPQSSLLALTAKTVHFQGQTSPRAGKPPLLPIFICYSSPSFVVIQNFNLIFVRISHGHPLPVEPVGPHGLNNPFSRSNDSRNSWPSHPKRPIFKVKRALDQPKFYLDVRYDLTYGASWPSWPKRSIINVKESPEPFTIFLGDTKFQHYYCQNFTWTTVKTFPMEPLVPHGQNGPFSSSKNPRVGKPPFLPIFMCYSSQYFILIWDSDHIFAKILPERPLRPYLWSQLALTTKTAHFQVLTSPRADLTYGASWPSLPKRPIFKALTAKTAYFQGQTIPGETLPMDLVGPHGQNGPFSRSNDPRSSWPTQPRRPIFTVKQYPEQTLPMEPVGPHVQNGPFSRILTSFLPKFYLDVSYDLIYGASWPSRPKWPILKIKRSPETSIKTLPMELVAPHGQNGPFTRSNKPKSKASWPSRPTWPVFMVKQATEQTITMKPVGPHDQYGHFQGQTIPRADLTYGASWPSQTKWPIFKMKRSPDCPSQPKQPIFKVKQAPDQTLPMEPVGPHGQNDPLTRSNNPRAGKPRLLPIFMCYSSPPFLVIQNSDLILAKKFPGRPCRPYLWSQLSLTSKTPHFQGQTLPGRPLRPYLWSKLAITAKMTYFQVQTIPGADLNYGASSPSRPKCPILKVKRSPENENHSFTNFHTLPIEPVGPHGLNSPFSRNFVLIFANYFCGCPLRPYLWSQLTLLAKTTHFRGQNTPRVDLSYRGSWPSRPKRPILKVKRTSKQPKYPILKVKRAQGRFFVEVRLELSSRANWHSRPKRPIFEVKRPPKKLWNQLALKAKTSYFKGQTNPGADLSYGANWPSRPKRPIFEVKRTPEKILVMEPVGPHDQNSPLLRTNDPWRRRPLRPFLWSQLTLMAKTSHIQGQTTPGLDLSYGAIWPSWPKHPNLKVKRSLEQSMDFLVNRNFDLIAAKSQLALTAKTSHFEGQMNPGEASWPSWPKHPILKVKRAPEQLALTTKTSHYQGQTIPEADLSYGASWPSRPKRPILKVKRAPELIWRQLALTTKTSHFEAKAIPGADLIYGACFPSQIKRPILEVKRAPNLKYGASWPSWTKRPILKVKRTPKQTLTMELVGPNGQNVPLSRSNEPREDHSYGSNWPSQPNRHIFKVKRSPKKPVGPHGQNNPFSRSNDPRKFKPLFCQKFSWMSAKTLTMESIDPHDQNGHISRPNEPRADKPQHFTSVKTFAMEPVGPHGQKRPIFKFAIIFGDSKFRSHFCQKFSWTSVKTLAMEPVGPHGQNDHYPMEPVAPHGQKRPIFKVKEPRSEVKPHFPIFVCYSPWIFGDRIRPHFAKFFVNVVKTLAMEPVGPHGKTSHFQLILPKILWASVKTLAMEPVGPHGQNVPFQGQTNPRANLSYGSQLALMAKMAHFGGQSETRVDLAMELLALTEKRPIFKSKRALNLSYRASCPSRPKRLIFMVKRDLEQTLAMKQVVPHGRNVSFSRSNETRSSQLALTAKMTLFDGQTTPEQIQLDLTAKTSQFEGQASPGAVHGLFGDLEFRAHFCQILSWTFVKTLAMEPVVPHGQNFPFSRSNKTRSITKLWGQLALTAKTARFQGQTIPGQTLVMDPIGPQPNRRIFKVKTIPEEIYGIFGDPKFWPHFCQNFTWTSVITLIVEPVGPHDQNNPFSRSNDPRNLSYGANWPSHPKRLIFKVKRALEQENPHFANFSVIHGFFCDPEFKPHFCQKFSWTSAKNLAMEPPKRPNFKVKQAPEQTSVKTFAMEPVGPHGQNDPYSWLTEPWSRSLLRHYPWSQLPLTAKTTHFQGQKSPGADLSYGANWPSRPKRPIFKLTLTAKTSYFQGQTSSEADLNYGTTWPSRPKCPNLKVKRTLKQTFAMEPVGPHSQNGPFWRSNETRVVLSYGASWPSWPKQPIFELTIFFGDLQFRPYFGQKFSWTSIKTLVVEPVDPNSQDIQYSRSNDPQIRSTSHFADFHTLAMEPVDPHGQNVPYSRSNDPRIRSYLRSKLALTAKMTHFDGQTTPRADLSNGASWPSRPKHSILKVKRSQKHVNSPFRRFSCAIAHGLFDLSYGVSWPLWPKRPILKVERALEQLDLTAKTSQFEGQASPEADLNYEANWPSQPKRPILKVKRTPEHVNPLFCQFSCAIVHGLFGDLEFRAYFCQKFLWTSVKTLAMEPVVPHGKNVPFSRQMKPGANLSYEASWPSQPKRLILKVKRSPEQRGIRITLNDFEDVNPFIYIDHVIDSYCRCTTRSDRQ
ncbi:hypothetical protein H5410_000061 [Solanum commersonii]|uniref:Uncharacterized protein n=1 Tax=Solanum commersonii TaxID=4109 RepID=A0A9J6AV03_SOLCO|nr:hypothetical protein H5410_000061 [Solanum commersonii]